MRARKQESVVARIACNLGWPEPYTARPQSLKMLDRYWQKKKNFNSHSPLRTAIQI
jgi:hypothetical protein